jgi:LacI family transcriptional regulator
MAATLNEVAQRAGVSVATASRALSGRRVVAADLIERVRAAAEDLGYRHNALAASLRRQQTGTIGLVVPQISNPFFPALIEAVAVEFQSHGVDLLLCDSQMSTEIERRRVRALLTRQVDGVLISPVSYTESAAILIEASKSVPLVQIDRFVDGQPMSWVGLDDAVGLDRIVSHLADSGARTMLFVSAKPNSSSGLLRLEGYQAARRRHGLRDAGKPLLGSFSRAWGLDASQQILASKDLPDAIVCGNDEIALGLLAGLRRAGVSAPGDVLVTGYDDITMAAYNDPPLTTVRQAYEHIAVEAVRLLSTSVPQRVALAPEIVVRESSGGSTSTTPSA